jgi:putative hydrolase of the HAD superfamily
VTADAGEAARPPILILDLGNVVAFFDHRQACRQLAALATTGATPIDVYDQIFGGSLEEDFDCGRLMTPAFIARLRDALHIVAPDDAIAVAWSDIFRPNDDVVSILPLLKRSTSKLVLASNTNDLHYRWLARRMGESFACFDEFVLSFQSGVRKPAPAFFQHCVEAAGVSPRECVYVDDREDFVEVATAMGMTGRVYEPAVGFVSLLAEAGIRLQS